METDRPTDRYSDQELLNSALLSTVFNYSQIYEINLEDDTFVMLYPRYSENFEPGSYTKTMKHILGETLSQDDFERVSNAMSIEYIKRELIVNNHTECRYKRKKIKGGEEWCLAGFTSGKVSNGIPTHAYLMIRRIEDIIADESVRINIISSLVEKNRIAGESRTRFLENISHEIRTPIATVLGNSNLALMNIDRPDRVEKYLRRIIGAGNELLKQVDCILEITRLQSDGEKLEEELCCFDTITEEVIEELKPEILKKEIKFNISERTKHHIVYSDRSRLKTVIYAIISNAVIYNRQGGSVSIGMMEMPSSIENCARYTFIFEDTGMGMSEDFLKKCTEPFTREKRDEKREIKGQGLGLYAAEKILDKMNGEIYMESSIDVGTRVTLNMDFRYYADNENEENESEKSGYVNLLELDNGLFKDKRFLVVDDNETNTMVISEFVSLIGAKADVAADGYEAVRIFSKSPKDYYDLVLMDLMLPGMDGLETSRMIKAANRNTNEIPVIAITANVSKETEMSIYSNNMNGYVKKPIVFGEFISALRDNLRKTE